MCTYATIAASFTKLPWHLLYHYARPVRLDIATSNGEWSWAVSEVCLIAPVQTDCLLVLRILQETATMMVQGQPTVGGVLQLAKVRLPFISFITCKLSRSHPFSLFSLHAAFRINNESS